MPVIKVTPEEFLGAKAVIRFGNPSGHPAKKGKKAAKPKSQNPENASPDGKVIGP